MMVKKTDNDNLESKLLLRRYFLDRYHADGPIHVLDCCQGSGVIWHTLRAERQIASYWGLDVKPKKGRLQLSSVRVLEQPGWMQNVVDVDTYGSPWQHWNALRPNISQPTTVFLTVGQVQMNTATEITDALGLGGMKVPRGIKRKLSDLAVSYLLTRGCDLCKIIEAAETTAGTHARYLGVRVEPEF